MPASRRKQDKHGCPKLIVDRRDETTATHGHDLGRTEGRGLCFQNRLSKESTCTRRPSGRPSPKVELMLRRTGTGLTHAAKEAWIEYCRDCVLHGGWRGVQDHMGGQKFRIRMYELSKLLNDKFWNPFADIAQERRDHLALIELLPEDLRARYKPVSGLPEFRVD